MAGFGMDTTQWCGIAAFGLAGATCLRAALEGRATWRALALLQVVCGVEVALGWRYRAHDAVDAWLQSHGQYATRASLQLGLIGCTLLCAAAVTAFLWTHRARLGAALVGACVGTAMELALFGVETVSLHAVDAVMYSFAGPVKVIGWLWLATAALTMCCAWRDGVGPRRR